MDKQPGKEAAAARFALAAVALVLTLLLGWAIYNGIAGQLSDTQRYFTSRDLWWWLGGGVAGAIAASGVLALLWIAARIWRGSVWVLSPGWNLAVAVASVLIAGFGFEGIHAKQFRHQQQMAAEQWLRQQRINEQEQARRSAQAAETQRRWSVATQRMAQLEAGSVASTLAAAEAQSPGSALDSIRDNFEPFLDRHPWRSLSADDRAAFGAYARRTLITMPSGNTEASVVLGEVLGAEHGLADTHGAMDECARLHALPTCRDAVASLALYLCRNGPSCLDGYEGMDFVRLSKDISGAANWSCNAHTQLRDTELCAYVRGEKH